MARLARNTLAKKNSASPFVVGEPSGGGGSVGAVRVREGAADGYTLLFGARPRSSHPDAEEVSYDPEERPRPDLDLRRGALSPSHQGVAAGEHAAEFIGYAKANPGKLELFEPRASAEDPSQHRAVSDAGSVSTCGGPTRAARRHGGAGRGRRSSMYFGNASELMQHTTTS